MPFVEQVTLHHDAFWKAARSYLADSDAPIADSNFYYDRYLDDPRRFPERADLYRHLLTATDELPVTTSASCRRGAVPVGLPFREDAAHCVERVTRTDNYGTMRSMVAAH